MAGMASYFSGSAAAEPARHTSVRNKASMRFMRFNLLIAANGAQARFLEACRSLILYFTMMRV